MFHNRAVFKTIQFLKTIRFQNYPFSKLSIFHGVIGSSIVEVLNNSSIEM